MTTTTKRDYRPCPRRCGVDIRDHHSPTLVTGRCDAGPMPVADMIEWLEARGVGQPGFPTVAEAIADFHGWSETALEALYDEMHGATPQHN